MFKRSAFVGFALVLLLGACSSSTKKTAAPTTTGPAVMIHLFQFAPTPQHVAIGDTVTWTNTDDIAHTVSSGKPPTPDGVFDSGNFAKNQTFSFTFSTAGTFTYFCRNHNSMRGEISVA